MNLLPRLRTHRIILVPIAWALAFGILLTVLAALPTLPSEAGVRTSRYPGLGQPEPRPGFAIADWWPRPEASRVSPPPWSSVKDPAIKEFLDNAPPCQPGVPPSPSPFPGFSACHPVGHTNEEDEEELIHASRPLQPAELTSESR
jgi:hypothetical protein